MGSVETSMGSVETSIGSVETSIGSVLVLLTLVETGLGDWCSDQ